LGNQKEQVLQPLIWLCMTDYVTDSNKTTNETI
jgi:hypothetical protein